MSQKTINNHSVLETGFSYGEREHEQYENEGYCIFEKFLTPQKLTECLTNLDRMIKSIPPDRDAVEMLISTHQLGERWIWDIATDKKVLDMLERQIGPNIVLWSSHLLCKSPYTGTPIPWHQDAPYWNISGRLAAGLWIPFDDIDEENGAMSVLPRWHMKGVLKRKVGDGQLLFNEEIDPDVLPDDLEKRKVPYHLRAGQLAIHNTMIPHNSVPNRSSRWRRVLVLRYIDAAGEVGDKQYKDYRTGESFMRECYLVRGQDVRNRGLKRSPFAIVKRSSDR
jgi:phytanoyl-CoA hydroxylase